jgi:hypothetical protein
MSVFANFVLHRIEKVLDGLDRAASKDIYALSLLYVFENDDPFRPSVFVMSNTESRVLESLEIHSDIKPNEVRWNVAFWLTEVLTEIGVTHANVEDDLSVHLRDDWVRNSGYFKDEAENPDDEDYWSGSDHVLGLFLDICVSVAQQLHLSGLIEGTFGRSIPILIHNYEYGEIASERTLLANPLGVADDFALWSSTPY